MDATQTLVHQSRQSFDLFGRLGELVASRYLERRARRHVQYNIPPVAIFAFDFIGREIAVRGRFENEELLVLADFLAPLSARFAAASALDIGANIGNHSLFFAKMFRAVHSFEPNPRTFGLLAVNARLADNIVPHNLALGEESGVLPLTFNPLNVGEASLVERAAGGERSIEQVAVKQLDTLVAGLGDIAFIKLDVEGFEPQVLKGADRLLRERQPVVAFEQNPSAFVDGHSETVQLLQDAGYKFCILSKRHVGHGLFGHLRATWQKITTGLFYDVLAVDHLPRGHYSMIVALNPDDLAILARI